MFDLQYYSKFKNQNNFFLAGCDEVGRGPLAGPVVAAAVSLHFKNYDLNELEQLLQSWYFLGVDDSKKLSSQKRKLIILSLPFKDDFKVDQLSTFDLSENIKLKILIKEIPPQTIDQINILNASLTAMKEACLKNCDFDSPGVVLIDGNRTFSVQESKVELVPVIKGDSKSLLIALASIIAKEYRDELMIKYDRQHPGYHWDSNAGYGTAVHLAAIRSLGITGLHRKTFKGVKEFL